MKQLELRTYTRQEIAEITGRKPDSKNFARDAKGDLDKWGYKYEYSPKAVLITKRPETAEERLKEIMVREFALDIQIDVRSFARFISLLLVYEPFSAMPWDERVNTIEYWFGMSVSKETMRSWTGKLEKSGYINKTRADRAFWRTGKDPTTGKRMRTQVDEENDEDFHLYKERQKELINGFLNEGINRSDAWKSTFSQLWAEFDCCYYACSRLILNGFDTARIIELSTEICGITTYRDDGEEAQ